MLPPFRNLLLIQNRKKKMRIKKAKRHYVSGGGKQDGITPYNTSDYVTHKDIKKFPRIFDKWVAKDYFWCKDAKVRNCK